MRSKVDVGILGATGAVGQRFVSLLSDHPWFRIRGLFGSDRSRGKIYQEAVRWILPHPIPRGVGEREVLPIEGDLDCDLLFSALPSGTAGPLEEDLARRGYKVFSNAKDHRMDPDVPLLLPEVNPDHSTLVERQNREGFIVTNGNCVAIPLTMVLKPLHERFGVRRVDVVSFQAVSGAGYPGVPSLDILGNLVPFIPGEEEKVEREPLKMLGTLGPSGVEEERIPISSTCVRVPVEEGHSLACHFELESDATLDEVVKELEGFSGLPQKLRLPSAPLHPIRLLGEPDRPQPRIDALQEGGMVVSVGRVRKGEGRSFRLFLTSSNTIRGAAGTSLLNAELFVCEGRI